MKISSECVPCLLKRVIFEAELSTSSSEKRKKVICETCRVLSELYDPMVCSATLATTIHHQAYEILDDTDPYKDLKQRSNDVALSLLKEVESFISHAPDPLKASMLCSIIGNTMDFGIDGVTSHPEHLKNLFHTLLDEGVGYDDYAAVRKLIIKSKNILFFTDNCGEIVFDKILCREIKKVNPTCSLILVVRGEPIISDATLDDARELHFSDYVDLILTTGCFAIGVDFQQLPLKLKQSLEDADLIIAKGMANYESFSETMYRPIVYLLRSKCQPIAQSMGVKRNVNVIKLYT